MFSLNKGYTTSVSLIVKVMLKCDTSLANSMPCGIVFDDM